jgi:hypothetical protein
MDLSEELDGVVILAVPRRQAGEHLERDDAEAPPVRREAVAARADNLGCHVLGRAAERARAFGRLRNAHARKAKVGELEVADCVEHAVLGLSSYAGRTPAVCASSYMIRSYTDVVRAASCGRRGGETKAAGGRDVSSEREARRRRRLS